MKKEIEDQLKLEIQHIFDSGANEIRVLEMTKNFINKYYSEKSEEDTDVEILSIGDSVVDEHGKKGVIICYYKDSVESCAYGVSFENFNNGHTLNGRLETNSGEWVPFNYVNRYYK